MLARRLRRRHNIKTTLGECLVLAGIGVDPVEVLRGAEKN